ncbi:Isoprenylcysteine carboxyl methyltransferase family-domain-containing protein [Lentinula lateritia]|uniref:Isoprenylcysteine carboxyl methyltransferase family-domain-containing protein n=1 Tax=Lentinula aff. lateritia TaxID=2804960 RepID=A0ACC1U043_9AGAR|nr:Isoprenylcysteine carboxyl methyltransferase family-domain-containing protein [Lentinula aff. lateritia]KAJ3853567.1 Isoprenylcysteine carboxyl methyltransferase family-domain-containing protein [Lentinula lateritia]
MSDDVQVNLEECERLQHHALSTVPSVNVRMSGNLPNTPLAAATIAFLLGSVFCFGLLTFLRGFSLWWWTTYQLGFFIAAWSAFHFGEFAVTAGWNLEKCSVESFLLDNGSMYHIANGSAVLEYIVTLYFMPSFKTRAWVSILGMFPVCSFSVLLHLTTEQCTGMVMVLLGQFMRSAAMIHASTNFSHSLAFRKLESHRLVTDGIYAWCRHPSYAGFFYWALGTQLVLQNSVCFAAYFILLWRFFYSRTRTEERMLVKFFGDDYVKYRDRVGTKIPFIP